MKIYGDIHTRGIVDIVCNKCKKSTKCDDLCGNLEYASLEANWGYGSRKDGERHETHLCEDCYDELLKAFGLEPFISEGLLL